MTKELQYMPIGTVKMRKCEYWKTKAYQMRSWMGATAALAFFVGFWTGIVAAVVL